MNDGEESDGVAVPMISSNKATEKQAGAAEREEGRRPTKENIGQHQTGRREEREEPESFTFLGFTHRCGINSSGRFTIWRHTARKRLEAKLQAVKQTLHDRMHEPVPKVGEWLGRVLTGHFQYFAVPGNFSSMYRFRERVGRYWRRALERRSQRGRLTASRIARLFDRWLPQRPRFASLPRCSL